MFSKDILIRNFDAESYWEHFLISALFSIFSIRIFLKLTDYPQLGGGDFHIAHILWGGFFMLGAIVILLSFLNTSAMRIASVLGGIGFGAFIDELGKFVTRDNDYFFEPTIALIYIIFVLLYLISRFIPRYKKRTEKEYLVNTIEKIKESAVNDFDEEDERQAKEYLKNCDQSDPIVRSLKGLLHRIDAEPVSSPSMYRRARNVLRLWYYRMARSGLILNIVIAFLIFQTVGIMLQSVVLFFIRPELPLDEWGKLYSSTLSGTFVLIGIFALRFSRKEGYRFFRIAILVTIFLTEFFAFMQSQWYELISLSANIFMLLIINYAMMAEKQKEPTKEVLD
ncbi:MAG: hypothetical protein AAB553_02145 [Patescibacteria group bacterium]